MPITQKPFAPRIWYPKGGPSFWALLDAPRRTMPGDVGDIADLTGNVPALQRGTSVSYGSDISGGCITFANFDTGSTATALQANATALNSADWTFGANFYAWNIGSLCGIMSRGTIGVPGQFNFYMNTAAKLALDIPYVLGNVVVGNTALVQGVVYRADVVKLGTLYSIYINGGLDATGSTSSLPVNSGPIRLGGYGSLPVQKITSADFYPRALSATEIFRNYSDPFWRLRKPSSRRIYLMGNNSIQSAAAAASFIYKHRRSG